MRHTGAIALGAMIIVAWFVACASNRDVIPNTHDVHGPTGPSPSTTSESPAGYEHVETRPHVVVALAESRGVDKDSARRAIRKLADSAEACARSELAAGHLVKGAGRIAARVTDSGQLANLNVQLEPGGDIAANALVCVVAPAKLIVLTPTAFDAGAKARARGLAFEVLWDPEGVRAEP